MANKKKVSVITKEVYHGGIEKELHDFKSFLWFAEEFDYAYGFGPNIICANLEVFNPFIAGNTDAYVKILGVKFSEEFETLASKLGMKAQELLDIYAGDKTNCKKIFNLVRTVEFRKLIESKGYDGVYTIEEGDNKCWGVLSTSQVTVNSIDTEDEDEWYEKEDRIIFKPDKPLEESISDELKIYTEATDAYDGQVDMIKYAYLDKTFVGYLQYSVYKDMPYIQMIEVAEDYKRQGIATKLLQSLQKDYPNKPIHTGWQTEEGSKLFDKVSVVKKNPVHSRYKNELKKIDKQIEEIDKKWEEYYNSDMSTMTDEEVEELNKLDNKLEDKRYALQKKLQDTEKSYRYIKEEYIEYNTPQRERSGLASTKVLITTSPYDMLDAAREYGYYDFPKWELDSYIDNGLDNDTLYYALYTPKGERLNSYGSDLGEDDYDEKYEYDFGTITTRTSDWKKVPLSKALGNYNKHTQLGWKKDDWGEWAKDIQVVESLKESLNDAKDIDVDYINYFSRGWILPNGKIISTHNGPHYENGHEYDDQSKDIRFNFGYERYIGLPDNVMPTNEQFKTLTTLLDYYFINADMVGVRNTEVEICYDMDNVGNFKTSAVSPKDYTSDELIKHIKRLLSSRDTTEKLEQTFEENLSEEEKKKLDAINNFIDRLYGLRQESIQTEGEFGIGNLVFKEFRNLGYLEYLKKLKNRLESKNLSLEGLNEGLVESISKSTPYMLRNDGELLYCKTQHPYIIRGSWGEEYSFYHILQGLGFYDLVWFYKNTKDNNLKDEIEFLVKSIISLPKDLKVAFALFDYSDNTFYENSFDLKDSNHTDNLDEIKDYFYTINDKCNQEFCRVRTSDLFKGGNDNSIYFRISSKGFNWFDIIWNLVLKYKNNIDDVTIVKDDNYWEEYKIVRVGNTKIDHLPTEEFINLPGNPIVEHLEDTESFKLWESFVNKINEGKTLNDIYGNAYYGHIHTALTSYDVNKDINYLFVPSKSLVENYKKRIMESIYIDEVKDLFTLDNFKKAAEEYIAEDPSTVSKGYIDPDGEMYNVDAIADTHASWMAQVFDKIYEQEKGKSWYSEFEDDEEDDLQEFFDDIRALLDDWGFIQCSTDIGGYIAISENPTDHQYLTLLDWLYGMMERGSRSVEVSLFTSNWTQYRYDFSEDYLPEDVIKSIKKAIATKSNLQESIIISPMTPYMLRNDGVLLECGSLHPYVNISYSQSFEDSYRIAKENPRNIKWFINNTNQDEVKKLGEKLLKDDLAEEEFNRLNDLTNQEFCRVRTSNFKVRFGGNNGEIYFRISSKGFNWFDLIWEVVMTYKDVIKNVTVVKDIQSLGGKEFNYYLVDGKKLDHMGVEEFLTLKGNPIIESKEDNG